MWTAITYELYVFVNEDISPDPIIFTIESDDITISIDNDISATYSVTTGNGTTVFDAVHIGYRLVGWYEGMTIVLQSRLLPYQRDNGN